MLQCNAPKPEKINKANGPMTKSMSAGSNTSPLSLYERDYYTWALEQARALHKRQVEELDWDNLAEEVEDLARRDARSLRSQLARLLAHLLKWQVQPTRRTNSWRASIQGARNEIRELLEESSGLKARLPELSEKAYGAAVTLAVEATNLDESRFPASSPWTFEQAMEEDFWPEVHIPTHPKTPKRNKRR
jgi:Domain of unknown function DUF29